MTGALMRYDAATGLSTPVDATSIAEPNYYYGTRGTDLTVNNSVSTPVLFSQVNASSGYSVDGFGGIIVPERGVYLISASLRWDTTNTTNRRQIQIAQNLTITLSADAPAANLPATNSINVTGALMCEAGDLIYVYAYQTSGASVTVTGDTQRSWLTIARAGSNEGWLADWFGLP